MTDQEQYDYFKTLSTSALRALAEDHYRMIYRLRRDTHMMKNILINRGEDVGEMVEYGDTPHTPWKKRDTVPVYSGESLGGQSFVYASRD